ncbi:uncharacterized protein LOC141908277 [Tubulanus polymorphus]|uniref:uncharacterized protein LOC141908277 n=1 Tax=Tubulanus polymorphus TaxID=672921 RepID=UPI003DA3BC18
MAGTNKQILVQIFVVLFCFSQVDSNQQQLHNHVTKVHLIYMNHLDVGYWIPGGFGYLLEVVNGYFSVYFPRAISTHDLLIKQGYVEKFTYTTHPWLVSLYLDCPKDLTISGIDIKCPNATQVKSFENAIREGAITWHAGPMNMQFENGNGLFVESALNVSRRLDDRFGIRRKARAVSQRDVPGTTKAVIPYLVKSDIQAISIGINPGSPPTDFAGPTPFIWRYNGAEILAVIHKGGYPNNPGPYPAAPSGLSVDDCHWVDGFPEALCFAFRTDNSGPPGSVAEILGYHEILRAEFPNAKIVASTMGDFFAALAPYKSLLPIATEEIGDVWITGISSDPRKTAEYCAVMRVMEQCVQSGMCSMDDPVIVNAMRFLIKPMEHTWGSGGVSDLVNWSNQQFEKVRTTKIYQMVEKTWHGQRECFNFGVDILQAHPVYPYIKDEIYKTKASAPDLTDYARVADVSNMKCKSGIIFSIGKDGAINRLYTPNNRVEWASEEYPLAKFVYTTYNQTDFRIMADNFNYYPLLHGIPFGKVNSDKTLAHPESRDWMIHVTDAYMNTQTSCDVIVRAIPDEEWPHFWYGAPNHLWIKYKVVNNDVEVEYLTMDKTTTRLAEALWVVFKPRPQPRFKWTLYKLGLPIDMANVMMNGSQHQHGSDKGFYYGDSSHGLRITSSDLILVSPITSKMSQNALPIDMRPISNVTGVAYNIYNNAWSTNYITWYPYSDEDRNIKSRFKITPH